MAVLNKCLQWIFVLILGLLIGSHAQTTDPVSVVTPSKPSLKVASVLDAPFLTKKDGIYIGYVPELLGHITSILGADLNLREPTDGHYGKKNANGSWDGLMKLVTDDEVDVVGPLTMSVSRMEDVSFSYPVMCIGPTIVMHRPKTNKPPLRESLTRLLHPLEFPVWLMTVLSFLVTGTVLYIISHFNPYEWRRMAKDKEATIREAESFTCLNSFWFVISSMAWQGYVRAPRSMGGRITVTAWWFFVIIFILSYTASLTNYLRFGLEPYEAEGYSKIKGFEDLVNNDDVLVGILSNGATEAYFRNSSNEVERRIYNRILSSRSEFSFNNVSAGIKQLRDRVYSDVALILESTAARYHVNRKPCDLYMIQDRSVSSYLGFAIKNQSTAATFNRALLVLQERGILMSLEQKWFKAQCPRTEYTSTKKDEFGEPTFYQLDLGTFSGALLILTFGIVFGGIVSLVEYCIFKFAESPAEDADENAKPNPNPNRQSAVLESDQNEQLLPNEAKRGGATQV